MDPFLTGEIEQAIAKTGCKPHRHGEWRRSRRDDPRGEGSQRDDLSSHARRDQSRSSGIGRYRMTLRRRWYAAYIFSISSLHLPTFTKGQTVHNLGRTRSSQQPNHLLLTPDTFVRTTLPGMTKCSAIVHVSPALGAKFTQYTAEFESGGELGHTFAQRFIL